MSDELTVTTTQAKASFNALLARVAETGTPVTITNHGQPVAVLAPIADTPRRFGQLPTLVVPDDFDEPLSESELAAWERGA
jgi:prevent-host-death family protein